MATYRLSVNIINRQGDKNFSSVAAACYRAEEKLKDEKQNKTFDYSKKNFCLHKEIITPSASPDKFKNRKLLWNEVEKCETRKKSQLAKEFQVSLPHELDLENQKKLVQSFCQKELVAKGMICDIAIHNEKNKNKNFHAHILTTMRDIEGTSFGKKNRDWNGFNNGRDWTPLLKQYRESWEKEVNKALEQQNIQKRVSCLSNKKRGLKPPKKSYNQPTFRYFCKVAHEIEKKELYEIKPEKKKVAFYPPEKLGNKPTFKDKKTKKYFLDNILSFFSKNFIQKIKEKVKTQIKKHNDYNKQKRSLRADDEKPRYSRDNSVNRVSDRQETRGNPSGFISKLKRGSKEATERAFAEKREADRREEQAELDRKNNQQKHNNNNKPSRSPRR